jgi:transcriptional regulator NrdR family protein|tara:strand:+ start:99 stop:380 length:282 start_codon:yes stop_codon:yes gene_type:complete
MKFTKSHIKQIIMEEIQTYMDEVIDNVGLEIEEEVPSDEEHLLSLLTKEFDRIPADRRKSVYTRFLSAANKYADRVSVASSPEGVTAIQEEDK